MTVRKITRPLKDDKEFKKLKKLMPFEDIRNIAKSANFSLLFGASPWTFMMNSLEPMWSLNQAESFITTNKLESLKDSIIDSFTKRNKPIPFESIDYLTCATFIRTSFFKSYPGLLERIERNKNIVKECGYTRTHHGVIRRLPLLMLSGTDDDYKEISGMVNIGANSEIQSLEAIGTIMPAIVKFNRWARRSGLKSRIWSMTHDSADFYLYRPELIKVILKVYEIFEIKEEWQLGIPLTIDFHIADPKLGEYYKSGTNAKEYLSEITSNAKQSA